LPLCLLGMGHEPIRKFHHFDFQCEPIPKLPQSKCSVCRYSINLHETRVYVSMKVIFMRFYRLDASFGHSACGCFLSVQTFVLVRRIKTWLPQVSTIWEVVKE
jgi:hypothetical protein